MPLEQGQQFAVGAAREHLGDESAARQQRLHREIGGGFGERDGAQMVGLRMADGVRRHVRNHKVGGAAECVDQRVGRSEEHTSELQSLMRISYAVFCLKKKNRKKWIT